MYFDKLMSLGEKDKPHIIHCLIYHICAVWSADPELSIPFSDFFPRLLLYKEPKVDYYIPHKRDTINETSIDQNPADTATATTMYHDSSANNKFGSICRFEVLFYLENLTRVIFPTTPNSLSITLTISSTRSVLLLSVTIIPLP